MPGRSFSSNGYRYGFNTQEKDDEITGVIGANTTAMFWEYDTRLGRRWNWDPVIKPWESGYLCFSGNPLLRIDPNGDSDWAVNKSGNVRLLKEDNSKTDRIFAVGGINNKFGKLNQNKKDGSIKNAMLTVNAGAIKKREENKTLKDEKGKVKYTGLIMNFNENKGDATKVFEFMANNTSVEFSLVTSNNTDGTTTSVVTTSHNEEEEAMGASMAVTWVSTNKNIVDKSIKSITHVHSHPRKMFDVYTPGDPSDKDKNFKNITLKHTQNAKFQIYDQPLDWGEKKYYDY